MTTENETIGNYADEAVDAVRDAIDILASGGSERVTVIDHHLYWCLPIRVIDSLGTTWRMQDATMTDFGVPRVTYKRRAT